MPVDDPRYSIPRDLVGYGREGRDAQWPNGARIAVSICINYEEGAELTVLNGDPHSETWNWEKPGGPPFVNARQPNVESEYAYGSRSAIWRLLRLFEKHSFPFTLLAVGQALEMNPAVGRACVEAGHEIAGHGYRWVDTKEWTPEDEVEGIKKAIKAIKITTGIDPKGWYVGRGSPNSVGVVWHAFREMGIPLEWESDFYSDDVPAWVDVPRPLLAATRSPDQNATAPEKEGLLHVPYSYDCNDMKFHMPASGFGGQTFSDYLIDAFDMLYAEGGKMMSLGLHPRIIGKPGRARMLERFLDYLASKEDVWVTTRADIAKHWREKYPYQG